MAGRVAPAFISGKYILQHANKDYSYKSFSPSKINKAFTWSDSRIDILLSEAYRLLGELNGYSQLVPDVDLFIRMHVAKEAAISSMIEGTRTEVDEAVLPQEDIKPERRDDWEEVQNYIRAMNNAIRDLSKIPFSLRLIKSVHRTLLSGVRGEHKEPGHIRTSQNWIGGTGLSDAYFIPPHPGELPDLLSNIEKYWHNEGLKLPDLIKIAVTHYQLETIHPFLDGNGRTGRLLITLQLIERAILTKPTFYLSAFFEKNRREYFDSLDNVRRNSDIEQWIRFFLSGVIEAATDGKETLKAITDLRGTYVNKLTTLGRRTASGHKLLSYLFIQPISDIKKVSSSLNITSTTAGNLMTDFIKLGMVEEVTGYARNRQFILTEYLNLFRRK